MIEFSKSRARRKPPFPFTATEDSTVQLFFSGDLAPGTEMRASVNGEVRWRQEVAASLTTPHNWFVATPTLTLKVGDVVDFGIFTTE